MQVLCVGHEVWYIRPRTVSTENGDIEYDDRQCTRSWFLDVDPEARSVQLYTAFTGNAYPLHLTFNAVLAPTAEALLVGSDCEIDKVRKDRIWRPKKNDVSTFRGQIVGHLVSFIPYENFRGLRLHNQAAPFVAVRVPHGEGFLNLHCRVGYPEEGQMQIQKGQDPLEVIRDMYKITKDEYALGEEVFVHAQYGYYWIGESVGTFTVTAESQLSM